MVNVKNVNNASSFDFKLVDWTIYELFIFCLPFSFVVVVEKRAKKFDGKLYVLVNLLKKQNKKKWSCGINNNGRKFTKAQSLCVCCFFLSMQNYDLKTHKKQKSI